MSSLFYDHLLNLDDLQRELDGVVDSSDQKLELWKIIDDLLHPNIIQVILGKLPTEHHKEFLEKFHLCPHDVMLIEYLREKIDEDVEAIVRQETQRIKEEILHELRK